MSDMGAQPSGPDTSTLDRREYIFIDESGDPGADGSETYLVGAVHMAEPALDRLRLHVAAFRYHGEIVREFKRTHWATKLSPSCLRLMHVLADMTTAGELTATVNWLRKAKYKANRGPYLARGKAQEFRNYQLRRLLERHHGRRPWGNALDVVIDRWEQSLEHQRNIGDYLRGNFNLRPMAKNITLVDSMYCEPIQVIDVYARLASRLVAGTATPEESALAAALMDIGEVTGGLY